MNGGLLLVPIAALSVFGVLPQIGPEGLATVAATTVFGISLLIAARATWRGAPWARHFALVVTAGQFIGLAFGVGNLGTAFLLAATAAWLLWRPTAREFSAAASRVNLSRRRNLDG